MMKGMTLKYLVLFLYFITGVIHYSNARNASNHPDTGRDLLLSLAKEIQHGKSDSVRISANRIFQQELRILLQQPGPLNLDSVKNISYLKSPDQRFNLISWQLPSLEGTYTFFGFIRLFDPKTKAPVVLELVDSTKQVVKPESAKMSAEKWFGAVYYSIIPTKKDGKNYYTLLGWKGNNSLTTQKVVDVLYFSGNKAMFGFPFFKIGNVYKSRVIFEYNAQATMSLHYVENKKMIVFDHLSSGKKNMQLSAASGPDGTYDAFRFKNGRWELIQDVDVNAGFKPKPETIKPIKDQDMK